VRERLKRTPNKGVKEIRKFKKESSQKKSWRTFCIMGQQVNLFSEPNNIRRRRSENNFEKKKKLNKLNPKSSELIMNKLKVV